MKRAAVFTLLIALAAGCANKEKDTSLPLSRTPVSVRGWIADVARPDDPNATFRTVETEAARRLQLFQATSVWVENAPFVSGGVVENGSFVLLDVPPGNVTITFTAPGADQAKLVLANVPGNADVLIPALVLKEGGVDLAAPDQVRVRMAGSVKQETRTQQQVTIAGRAFPVVEVPMDRMTDRRDFPEPPGYRPAATVK